MQKPQLSLTSCPASVQWSLLIRVFIMTTKQRDSLEAQLVKAADVIDLLIQAYALEHAGANGLDEFWEVAKVADLNLPVIADEVVKEVLQSLLEALGKLKRVETPGKLMMTIGLESITLRGALFGVLLFVVTFAISLAVVSFIMVKIPANYFRAEDSGIPFGRHPAIRLLGSVGKNVLWFHWFSTGNCDVDTWSSGSGPFDYSAWGNAACISLVND